MPGGKQQHYDSRLDGQIVASYGRRYVIELPDTTVLDCVTRGRRGNLACGDRVSIARGAPGQGVIEATAPRSTLLYRSDAYRQKLIAANVSQIVIVVAAVPTFYEDLINRCLVAAEHGGMKALIALNKSDLPESAAAFSRLGFYRDLGYPVLALCAKRDTQPLAPYLEGEASVLIGQSGMGKSTIINRLQPLAVARVAELSIALDSGRHTTTYTQLYRLNATSCIIDSPGMQEFGLHHLSCDDAAWAFVEFRCWLGRCRFRNCRHITEPGCAIEEACNGGKIGASRLASYRRLAKELDQPKTYRKTRNRR